MALQAVIFDLGGVVLGSPLHAFRAYERELGLDSGFLSRMIVGNGERGAWARLERGELDMPSFIRALDAEATAAGVRISTAALMERIAAGSQPRPAMLQAVRRIRGHGLRTAALTNNWASDDQHRNRDLLQAEFDVFVESVREGMRKPDPRIYMLVCERLGVPPNAAVFLDDIGQNLKPARQLGMTTIKVDDPALALAELERVLGIAL